MNGTTTSVYFGTIHNDATILLAKIIEEIGQRACKYLISSSYLKEYQHMLILCAYYLLRIDVGKVSMDRFAPEYYCEETHQGIDDVRKFMEQMKHFNMVKPILTPRVSYCYFEFKLKIIDCY